MKTPLSTLLAATLLLLSGCEKDADLIDCVVSEPVVLTTTLVEHAAPAQKFTVAPGTSATLQTAAGFQIIVPTGLVRTDGQPLSGSPVQVQVREVTKRSEMIFTSTPTRANGQLLESAGMFNVAFQQDGQPLRLLPTTRLVVRTANPSTLSTTTNMQLFMGLPDSTNRSQVGSWTQVNTQSAQDSSRIFPVIGPAGVVTGFQVNLSPNIYNFNLGLLNWINCDRFVTATSRTNVQINVARPTVSSMTTRTFLVFNTLNSVLGAYLSGTGNTFYANSVPLGYAVTAVVLHQEGSQLYFGKQTATIAANQVFSPTLRAVTEAELVAEINAL